MAEKILLGVYVDADLASQFDMYVARTALSRGSRISRGAAIRALITKAVDGQPQAATAAHRVRHRPAPVSAPVTAG
jgi:hypothetical protein